MVVLDKYLLDLHVISAILYTLLVHTVRCVCATEKRTGEHRYIQHMHTAALWR